MVDYGEEVGVARRVTSDPQCHEATSLPASGAQEPSWGLTSLVLLGGTVGGIHRSLELLLLQGIRLTALRTAKDIHVNMTRLCIQPHSPPTAAVTGTESHGGKWQPWPPRGGVE